MATIILTRRRNSMGHQASLIPAVTVHIPVEVAFDLGKFQTVLKDLGGRLGCGPCISGANCTLQLIKDWAVDPVNLKVVPIHGGSFMTHVAGN
jgi:hypothetical protein